MSYTLDFPIQYIANPDRFAVIGLGKLYIGVVDGDPAFEPSDRVQVYIARQNDTDLAIPQPIELSAGGVPTYLGSPVTLKINQSFSCAVLDRNDQQVYYSPKSGEIIEEINALNELIGDISDESIFFIENVAAIPTYTPVAGKVYYLKEYVEGTGIGGGQLKAFSGAISENLASTFTAAAGHYFERINLPFPTVYEAGASHSADDTVAFQRALDVFDSVGVPEGEFIIDGDLVMRDDCEIYGCGSASVLKRKNNSTKIQIIAAKSRTIIRDLDIDGNESSQTVGAYAILGYRVEDAKIKNVNITENFGIGIGWSDSARCICTNVTVDGCTADAAGFYNDTYSTDEFYAVGEHEYINCNALNNQLDGISIGTRANKIIGGNYSYNGYGGTYGGALGAAGIFTLDGEAQESITIIGATANWNTEHGINVGAIGGVIGGCIADNNQLTGITVKEGGKLVITGNTTRYNGWYTGSANPTLWTRAGIAFSPGVSGLTISNNNCYDDRTAGSQTQEYGIRFNSTASAAVSINNVIAGNNCRFNKLDNDNINPIGYSYVNLTGTMYDDFTANRTFNVSFLFGKSSTASAESTQGLLLDPSGRLIATSNGIDAMRLSRLTNDGNVMTFHRGTGTTVGSISVTTTATAFNTSSDYRLKKDVEDLKDSGEFIDALRPVSYKWRADESKGAGFIAHELEFISPTSVNGVKDAKDDDGNIISQSVFYGSPELIANIVAELKSLRERVKKLESQ